MQTSEYRGYRGYYQFDIEVGIYFGRVLGIRDVVAFQSQHEDEVEIEFMLSVDAYIDSCKNRGEKPEMPRPSRFAERVVDTEVSLTRSRPTPAAARTPPLTQEESP